MAAHYDSPAKVVASALLLGRHKVLRLPRWQGKYREFIFLDQEQGFRRLSHVEEGRLGRRFGVLW